MAKKANPHLCKCGCGEPTARNFDKSGRFKGYYRYKSEHRPGTIIDGLKRCRACKELKPVDAFGIGARKKGPPVRFSYCRPCHSKIAATNRKLHYGSIRNYWLLKRYGVSEVQVQAMIEQQNGLCPICLSRPATDVDHCHSTNQVRGILCMHCNLAIGKLGDSESAIRRVVTYLTART